MGMLVGYARTSTTEQVAGLAAQVRDLEAAGCEKVWQERVSSVAERLALKEALAFLREGDTLVITKIDRLARSTLHFWELVQNLQSRSVALRILNLGGEVVDTASATGRLTLTIFAGFAQFEREIMLERQREGIAKAKAEGKYKGRAPTARAKEPEVRKLMSDGNSPTEIAKALGIGRASVYRILGSTLTKHG